MTLAEAAEVLRRHNEWRRWDFGDEPLPPMVDPNLLGQAIDVAIAELEKTHAPE